MDIWSGAEKYKLINRIKNDGLKYVNAQLALRQEAFDEGRQYLPQHETGKAGHTESGKVCEDSVQTKIASKLR